MAHKPTLTPAVQLTDRAQHLLRVLVESYIRDGQPVGSRTLARTADLRLSPATIRNVMADLEELGFVRSPHTSSGRVPTIRGYRLFVDVLLKVKPLKTKIIDRLKGQLDPNLNHQALLEAASSLLSGITQLAGIVTLPRQNRVILRQIEFLPLSEHRVLVILVMNQEEVQNRIIHPDRKYSESELHEAANFLNSQFAGVDLQLIREQILFELEAVRQDVDRLMRAAIELGGKIFGNDLGDTEDLVVDGQTNLMDYDELSNLDKLRQLFDAFAHKQEILHLLDRCIFAEGVHIFFGQESGYHVLDDCSVVSAPYAVGKELVGVLGVIGPTRMAYDQVIPVVDVTAKLLGAALNTRN